MKRALREAITLAGGPTGISRKYKARGEKLSKSAVSQWEVCPKSRAIDMEQFTERKVSRHRLRPDLYPIEEAA